MKFWFSFPAKRIPTRAKAVIQATGQLSLNLVVDEQTVSI